MASTKNPIRYPDAYFKLIKAAASGTKVDYSITAQTTNAAKTERSRWNAFRHALKYQAEQGNTVYQQMYEDSLPIRTSLSGTTLRFYTYTLAAFDIYSDIENQLGDTTKTGADPQPACAETDIATEMGMPSNAELLAEHRTRLKNIIISNIRSKYILHIVPLPTGCPAPEDDPIAAFEFLLECEDIALSRAARDAYQDLISQPEV